MKSKFHPQTRCLLFAAVLLTLTVWRHEGAAAADPAGSYPVGSQVEVQWAGDNKWYAAEILEFKDGTYKIIYKADGIAGFFKPDRVRPVGGTPQGTVAPQTLDAERVLFDLLDSSKNGYLSGTEITPEVKPYDGNGDGRILLAEFKAARAKARGDKPMPPAANGTVQPAAPVVPEIEPARIAPAPLPVLVGLKPKPGYITGRAVLADGRPLPQFQISAGGWSGDIHLGPSGTVPSLGQAEGKNGSFLLQPTNAFDRTKVLSEALVLTVSGNALLSYQNRDYTLALHPMDGKMDGAKEQEFHGKISQGVVRDFVLKLHGPKRGHEVNPPPRDTLSNQMSDPSFGAFYGGTVALELDQRQGDMTDMKILRGSKVKITLAPTGRLMDGSPAAAVVRALAIPSEVSVGYNFFFRDIPLGDYTATVNLTKPDGTAFPLRLKVLGGDWEASSAVVFAPTRSGYTETATIQSTR